MLDAPVVRRARAADHAEHLVALLEQQLGEVRPVLAGDAGDERAFGHGDSLTFSAKTARLYDDAISRSGSGARRNGSMETTSRSSAPASPASPPRTRIAARGFSTCVLERHPRPGLDTSTHNSGVIHAGIYYPAGIAQGAALRRGPPAAVRVLRRARRAPRAAASSSSPPTSSEIPALVALRRAATPTASKGSSSSIARSSPRASRRVRAVAALWSPESGIVNAEELVKALLRDAARRRASSSCRARGSARRDQRPTASCFEPSAKRSWRGRS